MTQDRIRVWNEETGEMMEPATIQEMLCMERTERIVERWSNVPADEPGTPDRLYGHLVFMRNTGIYANPSETLQHSATTEIFAEDLITHSTEPWVYRVTQKRGCWWAMSLCPDIAQSRVLSLIFHPTIVGNIYENRELATLGGCTDAT